MRFPLWPLLLALASGWATAQVAVTSDLLEVRRVQPGAATTVLVSLVNLSDSLQSVHIEVADLHEGAGALQPVGSSPWSLAPLVRFAATHILSPRERREVPIDVQVPAAAAGTYFGAVVVTPSSGEAATTDQGVSIRELVRYAVELIIDVPGPARAGIVFQDPSLDRPSPNATTFSVTTHNDGGRWAERVRYRFELYDAQTGNLVDRQVVERGRLYPGAGHEHHLRWDDLPAGEYQLLLLADPEGGEAYAVRYGLRLDPTVEGDPNGPAER